MITKYQVIRHGIEYPDFFQGCGVAFTEYQYCDTGVGTTEQEAIEDCLEQMAQSCFECDEDTMNEIEKSESWSLIPVSEVRGEPDDNGLYHVSVRYSVIDLEQIFTDMLQKHEEWVMEYVQTEDYAGEYTYLVRESDRISDSLRHILSCKPYWLNMSGRDEFKRIIDDVACCICDLDAMEIHVVDEYSSETIGYLDSFHIGEYEDQIEWDTFYQALPDEAKQLDESELMDAFNRWLTHQREFCISGSMDGRYPHVFLIVNTGFRVDFTTDDSFAEIVADVICDTCRRLDEVAS